MGLNIRSHFYIINETRPYERKAYDKKHKHLRETSVRHTFSCLLLGGFLRAVADLSAAVRCLRWFHPGCYAREITSRMGTGKLDLS